jgi:hypothetical protein
MKRSLLAIVLLAALCVAQGCTYLKNRADDAMDIVDVGFTFSKTPQFAAYYDFVPIIPIGYGDVKGRFVGLGGGKLAGWAAHRERSYGLVLWGQEEVGFGKSASNLDKMTAKERNKALKFQRTGLIGMAQGPFPGPEYLISCPHYLHVGWIGAVATPRYLQIVDFVLGWTTLDICFDDDAGKDGAPGGKPWRAWHPVNAEKKPDVPDGP